MTLKQTQFLFTKGEVGPYMEARADTNIYKAGVKTCENWLILPQGGIKRRPGFEFIDDHPQNVTLTLNAAKSVVAGETITQANSGAIGVVSFATSSSTTIILKMISGTFTTNASDTLTGSTTGALSTYASATSTSASQDTGFHTQSRLIPFNFSNEQEYVLIFEPASGTAAARIHVYKDDLYQKTIINGISSDVIPLTTSNIDEFRYTQTLDTLIIVHKDFRPIKIVRGASHTAWTARELDFDYVPLTNFSFDSGLTVSAVNNHANGEPNVSFGANVSLQISGGTYQWDSDSWPDGHVNMHIYLNGGTAKIDSVASTSQAYCLVEEELVNDDNALSDEWEVDAFSNLSTTYGGGWPRSVTFHQNRLIFGGSRDKPQTIFGSQSASVYNFKPTTKVIEVEKTTTTTNGNSSISTEEHIQGQVTDDAGFNFTMASDEVNIIQHLISQQQLYIFASGGEWLMEGNPVTPTTVNISRQTNYGIMDNGHKPIVVDTEAMFLSNNTELRAFAYNYNTDGYQAKNYTLISHHIITNPIDLCYVRSFGDTNSNYVFVVNGNGEMACMSINVEKDVLGWSRIQTNGSFLRCVEVDNSLYVLVKRTIDSTDRVYLEKMSDREFYVDSYLADESSSQATITLDHLPSTTVRVIADQSVHANVTLASNGYATLTSTYTNVAAGLHYASNLETLPATVIVGQAYSQRGENITKKRADIVLNNTQNLTLDGFDVGFETFNSTTINSTPTTYTGTKVVYLTGAGPDLTITANVNEPLKATILGATIEYKVPLDTSGSG